MKLKPLNHSQTPDRLNTLNSYIERVLNEDDVDSVKLLELIDKREELIVQLLENLVGDSKRQFAAAELKTCSSTISAAPVEFYQAHLDVLGYILFFG